MLKPLNWLRNIASICALSLFMITNTASAIDIGVGIATAEDGPTVTAGSNQFWLEGNLLDEIETGDQVLLGENAITAAPGTDIREVIMITSNGQRTQVFLRDPLANSHVGTQARIVTRPRVDFGPDLGQAYPTASLEGAFEEPSSEFWLAGDQTQRLEVGGQVEIFETGKERGLLNVLSLGPENGRTVVTLDGEIPAGYNKPQVTALESPYLPEGRELGAPSENHDTNYGISAGSNQFWIQGKALNRVSPGDEVTLTDSAGQSETRTVESVGIVGNRTLVIVDTPFELDHRWSQARFYQGSHRARQRQNTRCDHCRRTGR